MMSAEQYQECYRYALKPTATVLRGNAVKRAHGVDTTMHHRNANNEPCVCVVVHARASLDLFKKYTNSNVVYQS